MTEKTIAVIRPSQVLNLPHYFIWMVIGLLLFVTNDSMYGIPFYLGPVVIIIWRYLVVHCIRYEITTERIRFYRGYSTGKWMRQSFTAFETTASVARCIC